MIKVKGKSGIVVKILADSVNASGNRLVTYELTYPRIIHSELLTHKMLCSNSASSRAIPFAKMSEQLTAQPVRFGEANKGMQDKGEQYQAPVKGSWGQASVAPEVAWDDYKEQALNAAKAFYEAGYHKQIYNRLTEPFQMMKTVISGTEWDNFFWLRNHDAADPTLHELAHCMFKAREQSVPQMLKAGQWHLPYVESEILDGEQFFYSSQWSDNMEGLSVEHYTLEEAIKVSAARCAAVSFRNEDYGLEKCLEVYAKFVDSDKIHASTFCHQATPMSNTKWGLFDGNKDVNTPDNSESWQEGVSHSDRDGNLWSAQFKGFIMNRKLIPGENYVK